MDYEYYGSGAELGSLLAVMAVFGFFFFILAVAAYVVNAIFLMKLLKNARHKTPVAAWVPIWNTVSLLQVGGIKQPWIWALIFVGGSIVSSLIPYVGFIVSLAILVAAIIVTIYLAKGVQAGVGTGSTGGIVLAVLLPIIWVIWIGLASDKRKYDRDAAIREGSQMPINWFGESDLYAPFGATAPATAGNYPQSQPGYAQPQPPAPSGYAPAQQQTWGPPAAAPPAPEAPTSETPLLSESAHPETSAFAPPAAAGAQASAGIDFPEDLPIPPRFSTPRPPRSREDIAGDDGNQII